MGGQSTKQSGAILRQISETSSVDSDYEMEVPDEVLIDILSFVGSKDLLLNCSLVCKFWKDIIDGHSVWRLKCERENVFVPRVKFEEVPRHYYRLLYLRNPYNRNMIRNPYGDSRLTHWNVLQSEGDGFAIEAPPGGADAVPSHVGSNSCFSTSYMPCEKEQIIDLYKEGVHPTALCLENAKIVITDWYAGRFDCGAKYRLNVQLMNKDFPLEKHLECPLKLNVDDDDDDDLVHRYPVTQSDFEEYLVDSFSFQDEIAQWVGKEWHLVTHTFTNVSNVRYVTFRHFGCDTQFWAGNYGSKMTGSSVKVIFK